MATATHTLTGDLGAIVGEIKSYRATVRVNSEDGSWIDPTGEIKLGASVIADSKSNPNGQFTVALPTSTGTELEYCVDVYYAQPTVGGSYQWRDWSSGFFPMTADANLRDKAGDTNLRVSPPAMQRIDGVTDHGNVSGSITLDSDISTHWLDATSATVVTISDGPNGGTRYVSVLPISGADNIVMAEPSDVTLTDGAFATFAWVRGSWILAGAGSGEPAIPDTTPPTAVTNLAATPGDDGTTASVTFTPATDGESTAKHRLRYYVTGQTPPAFPTSGPLYNVTTSPVALTGLTIGTAYTVEIQSYSAGGTQATTDTATFTTPAPAGWNAWDSIDFADQTAGTYSSPKNFTTDTGKTLQATTETADGIIVGSGKVKGVFQQPGVSLNYPSAVPPAANRITIPYELVGINPSYSPGITIDLTMATGGVRVTLAFDYNVYDDRRMKIQPTFGSGYTQALGTGAAGAGYTKNAEWVNGVPTSGTLVIVPEGQVLKAYINDVHVYTCDLTANLYGGDPNPLEGKFNGLAMSNNAAIYAMTLETYTS